MTTNKYKGRTVKLNKPFKTPYGPKKFSVYVKNDKGTVVKVNFNGSEGVDKKAIKKLQENYLKTKIAKNQKNIY